MKNGQTFQMNTIWAKTDFNSIGIVGSTAYGIVSKLQSVIWVVGGTIRTVLTVIVGQFIGKEKYNDLNFKTRNIFKQKILKINRNLDTKILQLNAKVNTKFRYKSLIIKNSNKI